MVGECTAEIGEELVELFDGEDVSIFYDHGDPNQDPEHVCQIRGYTELDQTEENWITNIDILVDKKN